MTKLSQPRRWFLYGSAALFVILSLGIIMAGLILMRQGMTLQRGIVAGSSMEPHFAGPRLVWRCPSCQVVHHFARDTVKPDQPTRCVACSQLNHESLVDDAAFEAGSSELMPGETVRYARLRAMRSMRSHEISLGFAREDGLKRGDVVVIQAAPNVAKEIKRLVGFPNETISVRDGDLYVDGTCFGKSLDDVMRQAVVVHRQDSFNDNPQSVSLDLKVDNQLGCNAHDSHRIIDSKDIGIAMQLVGNEQAWNASVVLAPASRSGTERQVKVVFQRSGNELSIACLTLNSTSVDIASAEKADSQFEWTNHVIELPNATEISPGNWMIVVIADGFLVVGTPIDEWVRIAIPSPESIAEPKNGSINVEVHKPKLAKIEVHLQAEASLENLIVFRDLELRGVRDADSQEWGAEPGVVVLGDNVSASSDSRDRWEQRPGIEIIKGVVLGPKNPIECLLKQR